jgi:hypothetical protein
LQWYVEIQNIKYIADKSFSLIADS